MPLESRTRWNMGEIRDLRERAELPYVNLHQINEVVHACKDDFDLALSALTMTPRPGWVNELLELHPQHQG